MPRVATLRSRHLGSRLRRMREDQKLTMLQVTDTLSERGRWSETKLSRIENGLVKVHIADLNALLDVYKVDDDVRDELVGLNKMTERRGTRLDSFSGVMHTQHSQYYDLEEEADAIFEYGGLVPGPLQTPDYARALMATLPGVTAQFIEDQVEMRMLRKQVFEGDNPLRLWSVLDESAIRRAVGGPQVMREQLKYLLYMSERPYINLQVISFDAGAHVAIDGPFSIIDFDDHELPSVLYLEHGTYAIYEEDEQTLRDHRLKYDLLQGTALSVVETTSLITASI
jgi:transcriptional regulator with XRE-family HTH domain